MQNCPKCVVMKTRYMVDTTSQELPIEEKTFLKFAYSSALFFFSNNASGRSNFADFLTNMCISNCVRSVFFFFKPWLALCEVDFCYCDISNWYFWQVCGWSFILGLQIIVIIITDRHEFKFWLVSVFFPFHLLFFSLFVVVVFLCPLVFIVYHAS